MSKRVAWLWPLLLMVAGGLLLLDNYLLIDLDLRPYWPILLVLVGLQVLVRGDLAFSWQGHTFGITRGSVQSGSLEVESGEIDVQVRALRKTGRLIAGQYTARSRPELAVRNNHAHLRMQRGRTWWLSLADWDVSLANDLPWSLLLSSWLGNLEADLRGMNVVRAYVSSGFGGVTLVCPKQAGGTLYARSTFGDVRVVVPDGDAAVITLRVAPVGRLRVDSQRFVALGDGVYATREHVGDDGSGELPPDALNIVAGTTTGSVYVN